MKNFETIKEKYPDSPDISCFIKMVKGRKIKDKELREMFDTYVPHSDYIGTPKEQIISWITKEILWKKK